MENKIGLMGYPGSTEKSTETPNKPNSTHHEKPEVFLSEQDPYFKGNPTNENGDEIIPVDDKYQTQGEKVEASGKPKPKKVN